MSRTLQALLFAACANALVAPQQVNRRGNDVIVWRTETATTTTDQTVATVYTTIPPPTPTPSAQAQTLQQVQIIVNSVVVQYSYSSDRTVYVVPTTVQSTTTQTQNVLLQTVSGAVVTPPATTTLYNVADVRQVPVNTAGMSALIGTIPAASMFVNGQTVAVDGRTYTYYAPVVNSYGQVASVPMTSVPAASPVIDTPTTSSAMAVVAQTQASVSSSFTSTQPTTSSAPQMLSSSSVVPQTSSSTPNAVASISPTSVTSSAPAGTSFAQSTQGSFRESILQQVNLYRTQHNANALTWDDSIAASALTFAQQCQLDATTDSTLGENRAAGSTADPSFYLDKWYSEGSTYDYSHPGYSSSTGHFTQLVWANTTSMGCGFTSGCGQYANFLVCRFEPMGNVIGGANNNQLFIDNVRGSA